MIELTNYLNASAAIYGCSTQDILGNSRAQAHVDSRCFVEYRLWQDGLTIHKISQLMNRKATTVSYSLRKVQDLIRIDKKFKTKYKMFLDLLDVGMNN